MSKSRSIFHIDDGENKTSPETPAKRKKLEENQYPLNTDESQLFDNGFDDIDISSLEVEYSEDKTSQNDCNDALTIDDVLKVQQKSRAEKNRQKALALKSAKLVSRPASEKRPRECFLTGESLESQSTSSQEKKQ